MWAAEQKHPEAVKALLGGGADLAREVGRRRPAAQLHGQRVNLRAVEARAGAAQRGAAAAGITYEEQLAFEQKTGREVGGQRGLAQALGPDGHPLPAGDRAAQAHRTATPAPAQTPAPAAAPPAAPAPR